MRWFDGDIKQAIGEVRAKKLLFLVFVGNNNETCKELLDTLENGPITRTLEETSGYLALKLDISTELGKQFSQIYPVVIVPSIYFIGTNGVPLEVIAGHLNMEELVKKVDKVLVLHKAIVDDSPSNKSPQVPTEGATCRELTAEREVPRIEIASSNQEDDNAQHSLDEKVARAKQLLEEKRALKMQEEKELQRQREMERRKTGQAVQKMKAQQKDNEFMQMAEERQREKEEDRLAREKIKQQIAQDRAERAMLYKVHCEEEEKRKAEQDAARVQAEQERSATEAANRSNTARLQFRLPVGSTDTHQFPADATLEEVRTYVRENVRPPFANFTLSTTFPRREFTEAEYSKTLRALLLAPSAAVLVLPVQTQTRGSSSSTSTGGGGSGGGSQLMSIFWTVLSPLWAVFAFLRTMLFGPPGPSIAPDQRPQPEAAARPSPAGTRGDRPQTAVNRNRNKGQGEGFARREGNVYRISDTRESEDDETNTWNGNSTEQM